MFTDVLQSVDGGVCQVTINRPDKLNAFTPHTLKELTTAIEDAGRDPAVGVIVITGAGRRAFSAGGDVSVGQRESPVLCFR